MISPLDKACTGSRCEQKDRCRLYAPKPVNPFNCISPMDKYEECPYYAPRGTWGEGPEEND